MSEIKLDLYEVAADIEGQLKSLVPVRTGRLKKGITSEVIETPDGYTILVTMEDYFAWLKPKRRPSTMPTRAELRLLSGKLPKMNNLGYVKEQGLSPRARGIMSKVDVNRALDKINLDDYEKQIKEIINYDKL